MGLNVFPQLITTFKHSGYMANLLGYKFKLMPKGRAIISD